MAINVNIPEAYEVRSQINEYVMQLASTNSILGKCMNEIETAWESTGHDKASYILELSNLKKNIDSFVDTLLQNDKVILKYLSNNEETSSHRVSFD